MRIGILKEIKPGENRVAMTPAGAARMMAQSHTVLVEKSAGRRSGFSDGNYRDLGASITARAAGVYKKCDMVMKVKEPQPAEYGLMRPEQIVFTYFHFAASKPLTKAVIASKCVAIAYEAIAKANGSLPLLTPMSEVAGRMSIQQGAKYLEETYGGKGVLLGGVPGVAPATVVVLGGGVVGTQAARVACGMGAVVYILDTNLGRLRYLSETMPANCVGLFSTPEAIRKLLPKVDLVVGAVLVPGAKAPKLITRDMLKLMEKGTVLVDVAIDQGGCFETSRPTTHQDPVYIVDGIVHYCVANMPGAVSLTATLALTNATLPYALEIADKGYRRAAFENDEIASGINILGGRITSQPVADALGLKYVPLKELL